MIDWEQKIARTLSVQNDDDSHTEPDATTFHPSQLARCKRQATISKFGLEEHDTDTLGIFQIGTLVHEWLEESFTDTIPGIELEKPIQKEYRLPEYNGLVEVTGHADCYDGHEGVVYDFKTRNGWYKFDPPTERHIDQLTLYMDALGADEGQVVYLNKKDLEVRTWPENDTFEFDPDRRDELVRKAFEIRKEIRHDQPDSVDEVPFECCGCWICQQEAESP